MDDSSRDRWRPVLQQLVNELSEARLQSVKVSNGEASSWINNFKVRIETWTGEVWDWAPLNAPHYPLGGNEKRMQWKCVSFHFPIRRCSNNDTGMW
jgi:hypothetical protein